MLSINKKCEKKPLLQKIYHLTHDIVVSILVKIARENSKYQSTTTCMYLSNKKICFYSVKKKPVNNFNLHVACKSGTHLWQFEYIFSGCFMGFFREKTPLMYNLMDEMHLFEC